MYYNSGSLIIIVVFDSMYTRALTFENSTQRAHLGAGPRLRLRKIHLHAACWRRAWAWGCGRRGCGRWVAGGCERRGRSRGGISSSWGEVSCSSSLLPIACIADSLDPIPLNSALLVIYTHAVTHAHTRAHVACTCTQMRIHVTVYMHMHTHACIHVTIHMHMHTHAYM